MNAASLLTDSVFNHGCIWKKLTLNGQLIRLHLLSQYFHFSNESFLGVAGSFYWIMGPLSTQGLNKEFQVDKASTKTKDTKRQKVWSYCTNRYVKEQTRVSIVPTLFENLLQVLASLAFSLPLVEYGFTDFHGPIDPFAKDSFGSHFDGIVRDVMLTRFEFGGCYITKTRSFITKLSGSGAFHLWHMLSRIIPTQNFWTFQFRSWGIKRLALGILQMFQRGFGWDFQNLNNAWGQAFEILVLDCRGWRGAHNRDSLSNRAGQRP